MKINKNYISRFMKVKTGYIYPIKSGIYLHFNKDLEYIGIDIFIRNMYKGIDNIAYKKLSELIAKDFVEIINED